jgi:hypothetical protein
MAGSAMQGRIVRSISMHGWLVRVESGAEVVGYQSIADWLIHGSPLLGEEVTLDGAPGDLKPMIKRLLRPPE